MASAAPRETSTRAALEARLLDLFAPARPVQRCPGETGPSLWRLDAIHRAKNLAQLATSLANLVTRPSDFWPAAEMAAPARALARTYDILGDDGGSTVPVPCFDMVAEVAARLGTIFGQARNIAIEIAGGEVHAIPEQRRAMVLICSELVINSLKYAFPVEGPGAIRVTLKQQPSGSRLTVEDDGIGLNASNRPGEGSGLIDRLVVVTGATLTRRNNGGGGARVDLWIPAPGDGDGAPVRAV